MRENQKDKKNYVPWEEKCLVTEEKLSPLGSSHVIGIDSRFLQKSKIHHKNYQRKQIFVTKVIKFKRNNIPINLLQFSSIYLFTILALPHSK